jgi:hypothetical protein
MNKNFSAIMRTGLFVLLLAVSHMATFGQQYSSKPVTVGEDTFLPYIKGKVVNRIPENDVNAQKIWAILRSLPGVSTPQGYEVEAYSDGTGRMLVLYLMPYLLEEGETVHKPGSSINFYFNDIAAILGQPLQPGIDEIYTLPLKTGDFMGFPMYEQGRETTAIYKGNEPLFLPVSQEEYLNTLIQYEEQKQKENGGPISTDDNLKEIEKAYQELLKTDKAAAEEFKKEMESFQKDLAQNNTTDNLTSSYKKELARLSPAERKKQAYYALHSMEETGNFSGLVPENETEGAQPLVKANDKAISKNTNGPIRLIVVTWDLSNDEHPYSPRQDQPQDKAGYALTDDKMHEILQNQTIWQRIVQEVE